MARVLSKTRGSVFWCVWESVCGWRVGLLLLLCMIEWLIALVKLACISIVIHFRSASEEVNNQQILKFFVLSKIYNF